LAVCTFSEIPEGFLAVKRKISLKLQLCRMPGHSSSEKSKKLLF